MRRLAGIRSIHPSLPGCIRGKQFRISDVVADIKCPCRFGFSLSRLPDRLLVTSPAVLDELAGGIPEHSAIRMALVRDLPLLPIEPAGSVETQKIKNYNQRTEKATKHKSAA